MRGNAFEVIASIIKAKVSGKLIEFCQRIFMIFKELNCDGDLCV